MLVGCTDPEKVRHPDNVEMLGENAWGPYPVEMAEALVKEINSLWMTVLADHGLEAFPYGPPTARVVSLLGESHRSEMVADIAAEAARNWYREAD